MIDQHIDVEGEVALFDPVGSVDVHLWGGSVTVAVTDGPPRVLVEGVRGVPVIVRQDGGSVSIRQPIDGDGTTSAGISGIVETLVTAVFHSGGSRSADVAVLLPAPARTAVRTASADVVLSAVGDARVETASGTVTVARAHEALRASTASGDIMVADVGGRVALKAVSGEITVAGGRVDELSLHTVSGDAVVDADLLGGTHTFRSVSGNLALRMEADAGLDIDATSVSGGVQCGIGEPTDHSVPGQRRPRVVTGDGSARLRVQTVSGDVTVVARPTPAEVA